MALATAQSVVTTGAAAFGCGMLFSTVTMTHSGWFVVSMGAVFGGSMAVTCIQPITATDKVLNYGGLLCSSLHRETWGAVLEM